MASNTLSTESTSSSTNPQSSSRMIALRVLCPSFPPPNRFTISEIPLSSTVADLKSRISHSVPSEPSPDIQRLIYRGKFLSDPKAILSNILEPADASEHSVHLVLPPSPAPSIPTPGASASLQEPPRAPVQQRESRLFTNQSSSPMFTQSTQRLRYRGTGPSVGPSEAEIGLANQRSIETLRRQVELQARGRWPLRQGLQDTATMGDTHPVSSRPISPQMDTLQRASQNPFYQSLSTAAPSWTTSRPPVTTVPMYPSISSLSSGYAHGEATANLQSPEDPRLRLEILRQLISSNEALLSQGTAPPIDHIIWIRAQLFNLLDNQYRNPFAQRDGAIESLLTRVFNIYTRTDQFRVMQTQSTTAMQEGRTNTESSTDPFHAPVYLLSSPSGYQALLASPSTAQAVHTSVAASRSAQRSPVPVPAPAPAPIPGPTPTANVHPNPNPAVLENVVRQAILNQRLRNDGQAGFARNVRRIWLFIRLYFFCYIFSEPGTWSRVLYVTLAVLVSLLSETGIPQQMSRMFLAPVQQHLEGLLQLGADEPMQPQAPRTDNEPSQAATHAAAEASAVGPDHAGVFPTDIRRNVRRVERSLALFVASLIPGVGERQVEVRNAAEAARNAERARAEEEEEEEEEEQDRRQQREPEQDGPEEEQRHGGANPRQSLQ